jgi:hypothetical protein
VVGTGSTSLPMTNFVKVESKIFPVWEHKIIDPCVLNIGTRLR